MHSSTAKENPEIDYEKMYQDHECYIDTDSSDWHDYRGLEEFPDLISFLDMYRGCGLDESLWEVEEAATLLVKPYTISTLSEQCKKCPHSKVKQDSTTAATIYCLPGKKEKHSSCPLEEHFSEGFIVSLEYKLRENVFCTHCHKTIERPHFDKNSLAKLPIFDVRLNGSPAKLLIERKEEICPKCHKRIAVSPEIPNITVELKQGMTMRLIHAINNYGKDTGISGYCKKHIAQGYGISYSTLKKYCNATSKELRKQAEQICLKHEKRRAEEMRAITKFSYPSTAPRYSMALFFSELRVKEETPELCLCAAFDKKELDAVVAWAHGDFSPEIPSGSTDIHLDFLAVHCAGIIFPDIDQMLAFKMMQLAIAYGKFLKSGRYATEDRGITESLIHCLRELSSGDMPFYEFERQIEAIEQWSFSSRKQRIFRAARRVHVVLEKYLGYTASTPLREVVRAPVFHPTEADLYHAERIAHLIESALRLSAQRQVESGEDPEGFYGTNSELAILRLLYINPAVTYDTTQGGYMGAPVYGVPASEIEALLKSGLLDDRGRRLTDYLGDIPTQ